MINSPTTTAPKRRTGTRKALIAAITHLLAQRSLDAITIDEIISEARVAKGSFYNHFKTRRDLANTATALIRSEVQSRINEINVDCEDPAIRLVRAMSLYAKMALTEPAKIAALHHAWTKTPTLIDIPSFDMFETLSIGLRTHRFRALDRESAGLFVLGVSSACLNHIIWTAPTVLETMHLVQQQGSMMLIGLGIEHLEATYLTTAAVDEFLAS